ncbi:ABC transporter permease subunit [Microvenator marinus]|uniref:ABC transporter permease subunit n=1 Tax=Microvenator marinus TaxID=2600177 RepID=A0A5B8XWD4_9DELT|nr:ABC transporter permease subunit [Microvenator marinus]QED29734.1 ABC transporter permease subunit [Microvenator marinus]
MSLSNLFLKHYLPVWAIALNSFRDALRNKVLGGLLGLSFMVIGIGSLMGEMSLHNEVRVATNSGIFLTTLFAVVMGVYASVTLFHTELERRTIYTLLSKPIDHWHFLLGKFLGVSAISATVVVVLGVTSGSLVVFQGGSLNSTFLAAYFMAFLQSTVVASLTILFATFSGSLVAGISAFTLFVAGNLHTQMEMAIEHFRETTPSIVPVLNAVKFALPNFEAMNLSYELTYGTAVPLNYWVTALWYASSYIALVLMISIFIFSRKDFQ